MIINPFELKNKENESKKNVLQKEKPTNIIIKEICERLIKNNIEVLSSNKRDVIKENIKSILYKEYNEACENNSVEIIEGVLNKIYGYGIFQKYIDDEETTDIRAVKFNKIYVKQKGEWKEIEEKFYNDEEFETYIRFCAIKNGSMINFETPVVIFSDKQNRLRIEAGISPSSILSPNLVIRIHKGSRNNTLEELFLNTIMLEEKAYFEIKNAIEQRKNIILCGQGGSGKTTLLKAIINQLPRNVAITTNEETAELYLMDRNIIQRECVMGRNNGKNIDLEKLAKHALVMSNDVIVIGEIKGAEANVFFDSISTGHMGLATVHTDSVYNVINRLITLIKKDIKAQYYTEAFLQQMLAEAINVIIFMKGFKVQNLVKLEYNKERKEMSYETLYERNKKA